MSNYTTSLLDHNFQRIMLIHFGGIGDEILFFPVIQNLRIHFKNIRLSMIVEPRCLSIIENNYFVDRVYTFDIKNRRHPGDLLELLSIIRTESPELIISSGSSPLVAMLLFLSGIPYRAGYATNKFTFLLSHSTQLNKEQYAATMYYDLLTAIGFPKKEVIPEIRLPEVAIDWAKTWLRQQNVRPDLPLVLIHPGVSLMSKRKNIIKSWDIHNWETLIRELLKLEIGVVLSGGPDDAEELTHLTENISHKRLFSAYGHSKNIYQLGGLIQATNLMVCVDSAPMHLGVALNANLVAIFGPTDDKTLVPKRENIDIVTFDISCRPCLWNTRNTTCSTLSCLKEIEVDHVMRSVKNQLDHQKLTIS